ncbi:MAG: hypothetical protein JWN29_754, partial [Acidimicrobiales bacterium]|nr:hypothetical protein [Acidimicrobiales bacterium]
VSYGGTSLLVTMAATGLLLNVASHGPEPVKRPLPTRRSANHPAMAR